MSQYRIFDAANSRSILLIKLIFLRT